MADAVPDAVAVPRVDWTAATASGRTLVPAGPELGRDEAAAVVADLRLCAERSTQAVAAASALSTPPPAEVLVLDRAGWVSAVVAMIEVMLGSVGEPPPATLRGRVSGRLAGGQLGAALAFVATRILGQYDPYSPTPRLLLVAPNIVAAERSLAVEPSGFRQWVCLHEQTHRFQFGAAPWLSGHLLTLLRDIVDDAGGSSRGLRLLSVPQAAALDRVTAVMSLLEGYADVVMDAAAQDLVPQAALLRTRFEARRDAGGIVAVVSRFLGLRAKREQYLRGARFCRAVIAEAGVEGLNRVFQGPESLPTLDELHSPESWLRRVPGRVG
ncbi:MAG: zinc-dependent metalloprotease [Micropruina sp.]